MRLLVTGGDGYIGSFVASILRDSGHAVTVVDDLSARAEFSGQHRNVDLVVGDIRDTAAMRNVLVDRRIEAVIHLAALKSVADSWQRPDEYRDVNVGGTISVLDAMSAAGVDMLVYSSTCAIYGSPEELPVAEDATPAPLNPYGETKFAAEREIAGRAAREDLRFCTLRYFNAAGAAMDGSEGEQEANASNLIPIVIGAALGHRPFVPVYGTDYETHDGTALRDYVHVLDLADAHRRALEYLRDGGASAAFNLGSGTPTSVRQILSATERVTGLSIPIREQPRRPGDAPAIWADPTRARERLGWATQYGIDDILETAWRWHQRQAA